MSKRNHWYDYLWVLTALYLALGFFNILFAWLGLLCFFIPLIMASTFGTKSYCNKYCGRGQLFELIGNSWKLSPKRDIPSWLRSHTFRYGFLLFFTAMFVNMLVSTYLVFTHAIYFHQTVSLLWTFDVPWHWAYSGGAQPWVAQFAFGFYSIMLTSSILGIITLLLLLCQFTDNQHIHTMLTYFLLITLFSPLSFSITNLMANSITCFFENQSLPKLQFKYCLILNISNIFNYIIPLLTNIHL